MKNKKIPSHLSAQLAPLPESSRALFLQLWLESDEAGVLPLEIKDGLIPLEKAGLLVATESKLILKGYLSSNFSNELKPDYNPHKRPLAVIEKHGFEYNQATGEILLEETDIKSVETEYSSLNSLEADKSKVMDQANQESVSNAKSSIIDKLGSLKFALVLAMLLTLGQSFHTGYSLYLISDLPEPYNICFAVFVAFLLDALIVFFVVRGSLANSVVFLIFSTAMNLFALHHSESVNWFNYNSYFAILISIIIPYSIHAVASMVHADMKQASYS